MKIPFLAWLPAFALVVGLTSCGTGGGMNDAPKNTNLTGDLPGTGSFAQTAFEDSEEPYNNAAVGNTSPSTALSGQVVQVDSTEARGNSRWGNANTAGSTATDARLDKAAGKRARYTLIGPNPKNRSRVGQNLSAGNPPAAKEEIFMPQ